MRSDGASIRQLRERSGYTISRLAADAGIDRTHLGRIENGERNGTPKQLCDIAEILGVDIATITQQETTS